MSQASSQLLMPMIPLGLKETKEIEMQEPFRVRPTTHKINKRKNGK
jgi:hypothetical protein